MPHAAPQECAIPFTDKAGKAVGTPPHHIASQSPKHCSEQIKRCASAELAGPVNECFQNNKLEDTLLPELADIIRGAPAAVDGEDDVVTVGRGGPVLPLTELQQALKGEGADVGDGGDAGASPDADAVGGVPRHADKLRVVSA